MKYILTYCSFLYFACTIVLAIQEPVDVHKKALKQRRDTFVINGTQTKDLNILTNATQVGEENRYPCYVAVAVYETPALKSPYADGAKVTVITQERPITNEDNREVGFSYATTDNNGYACVMTLCRKEAVIVVEIGSKKNDDIERLIAVKNQTNIPNGFSYKLQIRNEELVFNVRSWGTFFGKTGPVYTEREKRQCDVAGPQHNHFAFALLGVKDTLTTTKPIDQHYEKDSWYYSDPDEPPHQVCYMKIKVKTLSYKAKFTLTSISNATGKEFGEYVAGPRSASTSNDIVTKAACLEFRCAVLDDDDNPMTTTLIGTLDIPSHPCGCNITKSEDLKKRDVKIYQNASSFSINIHSNDNYGPAVGIYKNRQKQFAQSICFTGRNDYVANYKMDPSKNYFMEYDCTNNCSATRPSIVGVNDTLTTTKPIDQHYEKDSWYYTDPDEPSHQVCYMKIKVKTLSYKAKLTLTSISQATGEEFGEYVAGPRSAPTSNDIVTKAACLEFRCAVLDDYDNPMTTTLIGTLDIPSHPCGCNITQSEDLKKRDVKIYQNATSFSINIHANDNYGPDVGIYKHRQKQFAQSICFTGRNDIVAYYKMDPSNNYFIEYDCTNNCSATRPSIVG